MHIEQESDILDIGIRKKIIEEIEACENQLRKDEHFKRYECYKDLTKNYVIEFLNKQFNTSTVEEMSYALSNISIVRKVIDKLARVYSNGVTRTINDDAQATETINILTKELDFNSVMKKVNRFLKLDKNDQAYIKPYACYENDTLKFGIKVECLPPFLYDVVEKTHEREKSLCVILSHYEKKSGVRYSPDPAREGRTLNTQVLVNRGNNKDEVIADSPMDTGANKKEFIFWSNTYHFTCNQKGEITSEGEGLNPIGVLPFVNFAIDQDGSFWALGGSDLVDMAIQINSMLTNMNHIAITQGYGQFFMKGKNLPRAIQIGPNKAILMEYAEGEPIPDLGYVTANPPLNDIKGIVEQQIALLLTTNNLSTNGIATNLNGTQSAASGVALILDKAESMEDVQDQAQIFHDKEPLIWDIINKWLEFFGPKNLLIEDLQGLRLPDDFELNLKFNDPRPIMSETEKLQNLKLRKDLGLNTKVELMMLDDASLTPEQAEEKLKELEQEKMSRLSNIVMNQMDVQSQSSNPIDEGSVQDGQDQNQKKEENLVKEIT